MDLNIAKSYRHWDDKILYLNNVKYSGEYKHIHYCQCKNLGHVSCKVPKVGHLCKLTCKIISVQNLTYLQQQQKKKK